MLSLGFNLHKNCDITLSNYHCLRPDKTHNFWASDDSFTLFFINSAIIIYRVYQKKVDNFEAPLNFTNPIRSCREMFDKYRMFGYL